MKLLFDQNLSPRLIQALQDLYPGSLHVRDLGLEAVDDAVVWAYAAEHRLIIVSKDSDFHQRSFVYGHPPKVVWIRLGKLHHLRSRSRAPAPCSESGGLRSR